ncbi:MAG: DUF6438 domain-containing protein [Bacteroidota bacterium]
MKLIFYGLILSVLFSCTSTRKVGEVDIPIIKFEKTSCFGSCPVYSLSIFENGLVILDGIKNIDYIGSFKKQLSRKEINEIIAKFNDANFFNFDDEYTSRITDLPTTYISYNYNGKHKKIKDYSGAPKKLKELEKIILQIVNEEGWEKSNMQ